MQAGLPGSVGVPALAHAGLLYKRGSCFVKGRGCPSTVCGMEPPLSLAICIHNREGKGGGLTRFCGLVSVCGTGQGDKWPHRLLWQDHLISLVWVAKGSTLCQSVREVDL